MPVNKSSGLTYHQKCFWDIIRRVEESEASWPARSMMVSCASVCKSWRKITKEIVKTPEECGRLTFPISVKQPGPRESPIQCFIKRDKTKSVYRLYFGMTPSEGERDKLLLAAKRIRRATSTDFVISLVADDFSRASNTYVGKLRSNFLGTKFSMYDSQPPSDAAIQQPGPVATISYQLNVSRVIGPRRFHCVMHSIPLSSIQEGGSAPTPKSFPQLFDDKSFSATLSKAKESAIDTSSSGFSKSAVMVTSQEPLVLKNKAPRRHEQLQCWCLNFEGRVTMASVKNFQLLAEVDPSHNVPVAKQEKIILQFGRIGKEMFSMDYRYPLSALQAFAICLSSFHTKPACE